MFNAAEIRIPYTNDIAEFINRTGLLPISARRAFKRVLATIKTIALIHQRQRRRDDMENVIAEYADYFIAYQLVGDSFRESLGAGQRYKDDRIRFIDKKGVIKRHNDSDARSEDHSDISDPDGGVKVLIEKMGSINNFQNDWKGTESIHCLMEFRDVKI